MFELTYLDNSAGPAIIFECGHGAYRLFQDLWRVNIFDCFQREEDCN